MIKFGQIMEKNDAKGLVTVKFRASGSLRQMQRLRFRITKREW